MSELIDRIFDVEKISAEVADILSKLSKITEATNVYKNAVVGLESTIRKSKGYEDLAKSTKSLNDNVIAGGVEMKRYESEVEKLRQKTEQLTGAEKAASIEIAKARLELQAAQKATKEAAIAEIELTAKNKDLTGSYNALQKDLQNSIKAFKALSGEEAKSAKGQELLKKIGETQTALKKSDAAMGNYQRNVGNYASAFEGLGGVVSGLPGSLGKIGGAVEGVTTGFQALNTASPVGWITILINILTSLFSKLQGNEEMALGLSKAMGFLNGIFSFFTKIIVDGTKGIVSFFSSFKSFPDLLKRVGDGIKENIINRIQAFSVIGKALVKILSGDFKEGFSDLGNGFLQAGTGVENLGSKAKGAFDKMGKAITDATGGGAKLAGLEKLFEAQNRNSQKLQLQYQIQAEKLRQIRDDESMTMKQRVEANENLGKVLKNQLADESKTADTQLKIAQLKIKQDGKTKESLDALAEAETRLIDIKERITGQESEQLANLNALRKESIEKEKERTDKILSARRRLIDYELSFMQDGLEKSLKMNTEKYNRELEDLKRNGELTKAIKAAILKAQLKDEAKIKQDFKVKGLQEDIRLDEMEIARMQKLGFDTLKEQKSLLQKQMDAEIAAGGDKVQIALKYQYLQADLEEQNNDKKNARFEETIKKDSDLITQEYQKKENLLKKDFLNSKRTAEDKEKLDRDLAKLKLDALYDVNEKTIQALEKELATGEMSTDKRAELSNKLAQLRIDNENAVTDATIQANDDQIKSDEDAKAKRLAVAQALGDATMQIFGAISDYAKEKSEQRISELEKELEASNTAFDKEQQNLDNSLMSDEMRAQKQIEIDNKKAAAEKVINDKIQAEKIKQAKWDKANAIVQAIISAGLAVLNAAQTKPFIPLGLIAAGLATTLGAVQIATIASQPIPAYEKGTDNHPGGLSLWGEKRAEVAVTPTGHAFLAEKPTISNFDAGTKIFKSVSDYENFIAKQSVNQMTFDYDKFGEKMPQNNIILDGTGLWSIVNKQNARRKLINRRYSS
jgi:hypothetical protein